MVEVGIGIGVEDLVFVDQAECDGAVAGNVAEDHAGAEVEWGPGYAEPGEFGPDGGGLEGDELGVVDGAFPVDILAGLFPEGAPVAGDAGGAAADELLGGGGEEGALGEAGGTAGAAIGGVDVHVVDHAEAGGAGEILEVGGLAGWIGETELDRGLAGVSDESLAVHAGAGSIAGNGQGLVEAGLGSGEEGRGLDAGGEERALGDGLGGGAPFGGAPGGGHDGTPGEVVHGVGHGLDRWLEIDHRPFWSSRWSLRSLAV